MNLTYDTGLTLGHFLDGLLYMNRAFKFSSDMERINFLL
jgi:hypothetical protein